MYLSPFSTIEESLDTGRQTPVTPRSFFQEIKENSIDKHFSEIPVSADLFRLARKYELHEISKSSHIIPFVNNIEKASQHEVIFNLLLHLSKLFQPQVVNNLSADDFAKNVNLAIPDTLTKYLVSKFSEDGVVSRLLKTCHQIVLAKALSAIKALLIKNNIQTHDVKGAWKILIEWKKDKNGKISQVSTIHRRKEMVYQKMENDWRREDIFDFEWEMRINFSEKFEISGVEILLLDFGFLNDEGKTKYSSKVKDVLQCFKDFGKNTK